MTYFNILYSWGVESFLDSAGRAGIDGVIIPDLPLDEVGSYSRTARRSGVDMILLAAPTTSPERMKTLVQNTSGFLYLVSLLGVTGARAQLSEATLKLVGFAKEYTRGRVPLGVGFGISKPEHVAAVIDAGADGAIVGSGIVNVSEKYQDRPDALFRETERYVRALKAATKKKKKGRPGGR
jgi:tryptophan synthase alpha chain